MLEAHGWFEEMLNGHKGWLVTYLVNNNSIFLPAAGGYWWDTFFDYVGSRGLYWSSSLFTTDPKEACYFDFGSGYASLGNIGRDIGFSIRLVTE